MDLIKKKYVCNVCSYRGAILTAIKDNRTITTDFLREYVEPLGEISENIIYSYEVNRDDTGLLLNKKPVKCVCEKCGEIDIKYIPDQKFDNVLNFYPTCENEKWLRGFCDLGQKR